MISPIRGKLEEDKRGHQCINLQSSRYSPSTLKRTKSAAAFFRPLLGCLQIRPLPRMSPAAILGPDLIWGG